MALDMYSGRAKQQALMDNYQKRLDAARERGIDLGNMVKMLKCLRLIYGIILLNMQIKRI